MPSINPRRYNATTSPDIQFSDEYGNVVEFALEDGVNSVNETPDRPSTLLKNSAGGKRGDFDNNFAHIEQGSFDGGFGQETFDDVTKYYDDYEMWPLTSDHVHNSLLRQFGTGIRSCDNHWPQHDMAWLPLYDNAYYIDTPFAASSSYSSAQVMIWVRRVGNPGTISLAICPDSTGVPGTATQYKSLDTDKINPGEAKPLTFTLPAVVALTSATTYHIKVYAGAPYTDVNHWEIGCSRGFDKTLQPSLISTNGTTWSNTSFRMYYRSTDAEVNRKFHFFTLSGCLYAVDEKINGTNSVVYMNGDRGDCDDNSSAKTTLIDASRSWVVNEYVGYRVRIIEGPGIGEYKYIISNTATTLTLDSAWQKSHTTASRYVIYGGPKWTALTLTGTALTGVVKSVTVFKSQAAFARGQDANILKMSTSASTHAGAEDSTNKADLVYSCYDTATDTIVFWRAEISGTNKGKISFGTAPEIGAATSFGTPIAVGDSTSLITNMYYYDDKLHISKEDGIWNCQGGKVKSLNTGFDAVPSITNGLVFMGKNFYLIINWANSIERYYGSTMDDFGMYRTSGIPSERRGYFSSGTAPIGWQFYSINAGSGTSSVWAWNDRGWHEIMRAFNANKQIHNIYWQSVEGGNPILWTDCGGDMIYMTFPDNEINPLRDETVSYEPVGNISLSRMNLGAMQIPKYVKDVDVISENMGGGDNVSVDYQVDGECGTEFWRKAGDAYESPTSKITVQESGIRNIGFRIWGFANDLHRPPVIRGFVAKMFGRTPYSRQWSIKVLIDKSTKNGVVVPWFRLHEIYLILARGSASASGLTMHSMIPEMDDIQVVVEPPSIIRTWVDKMRWGGIIYLTVREVG